MSQPIAKRSCADNLVRRPTSSSRSVTRDNSSVTLSLVFSYVVRSFPFAGRTSSADGRSHPTQCSSTSLAVRAVRPQPLTFPADVRLFRSPHFDDQSHREVGRALFRDTVDGIADPLACAASTRLSSPASPSSSASTSSTSLHVGHSGSGCALLFTSPFRSFG